MTTPPDTARVLVVDDDASIVDVIADLLDQSGYRSVRAHDPREALQRASEGPVSAAVVDLHMPGMDGIDLAERLQAVHPDTQVVILTADPSLESAVGGIRRGVFDYVEKRSLDLPSLARTIARAVERSQLKAENRELMDRLQDSNRLLKALQEVTAVLAEEPHLDRLLNGLAASAKALCRAEESRVVLLDRGGAGELVIETSVGDDAEPLRGMRLRPGEGVITDVIEKEDPVLLRRAEDHPRFSQRSDGVRTAQPGFLSARLRHGMVLGSLTVAGRPSGLGPEHRVLLAGLARQAAVAIDHALARERAVNFFTHTCDLLVSLLDHVDVFYPGHSRNVARLADRVTRSLALPEDQRRDVHFAALLHDIGKLELRSSLLGSTGALSEEGMREIRRHPLFGVQMLRPVTLWESILPIIHAHHERWDGTGYPAALRGEDIPLGARVVAVADAFDVMTRDTPHGRRRTPEEAVRELEACAGSQFDPEVVRVFAADWRNGEDEVEQARTPVP